ncbi:MAG TPA: hypothetical protein VMV95_00880 [Bacillota bacterium]|nr:hypothetical protein [Bacillota bacterium]
MNFQFYLEKLYSSDIFKKFMKENPKAYLCSGFFTVDKEGKDNQRHLDFYIPNIKKMFSFRLEKEIEKIPVETLTKKVPPKMKQDFDFNFEDVEKMIVDEMKKRDITNKLQKIIFSLQNIKGRNFLICTVFIGMLGLLKIHINLQEKKISLFEKKSFFDLVRRVK